jgi:hypothetical protein
VVADQSQSSSWLVVLLEPPPTVEAEHHAYCLHLTVCTVLSAPLKESEPPKFLILGFESKLTFGRKSRTLPMAKTKVQILLLAIMASTVLSQSEIPTITTTATGQQLLLKEPSCAISSCQSPPDIHARIVPVALTFRVLCKA